MATLDDWKALAAKESKGKPSKGNPKEFEIKPLYTAADIEDNPQRDTLPGLPPFIRGPRATMYTGRPWTIRQYAGFSSAQESNAFYRQILATGGQGNFRGL